MIFDASTALRDPSFYLSLLIFSGVLGMFLQLVFGNRSVRYLRDVKPYRGANPPKVSVVIAARNEERNIEHAIESVLHQYYPNLEVIAVDDRSTDRTGAILDRLAARFPILRVLHIRNLPARWLGKNHALWAGSKQARGDILVFADADIVMDPTTVSRAVAYLEANGIDHLPSTPTIVSGDLLLNVFCGAFTIFFAMWARPWKVKDPTSKAHIGVGAFNMIRKRVYDEIGGHTRIAMRPDDDMKLGKLVKMHGFRQEVLLGTGLMSVEWYPSTPQMIRGLMKNSFSAVDYSLPLVVVSTLLHAVFFVWPYLAVWVARGPAQILYLMTIVLLLLMYVDSVRFHGMKARYCFGMPIASLLLLYILWRATLLNLAQGGIYWRGTFYSLAELRKNKV